MMSSDPDAAADMYEWASDTFSGAGYQQYEISNWAVPGRECRHNLQYWRTQPYLGLGAGAHGYANGYRYSNVLRIKTYIDRLNTEYRKLDANFPFSPATVNQHRQTLQDEMGEYMMTGLRLTCEGIATQAFRQRFGREILDVYRVEIEELTSLRLLEWAELKASGASKALRLTTRGRLLGNQVFMRFIG
jgi:oxygen-independent coproporphyrinogen-3 oxidase